MPQNINTQLSTAASCHLASETKSDYKFGPLISQLLFATCIVPKFSRKTA